MSILHLAICVLAVSVVLSRFPVTRDPATAAWFAMFASCFLVLGVVLSIVSLSHSIAIGDVLLLSAEMDSYIVVSLIATGYAFAIRAVLGLAMASLHRLRGEWLRRRT